MHDDTTPHPGRARPYGVRSPHQRRAAEIRRVRAASAVGRDR